MRSSVLVLLVLAVVATFAAPDAPDPAASMALLTTGDGQATAVCIDAERRWFLTAFNAATASANAKMTLTVRGREGVVQMPATLLRLDPALGIALLHAAAGPALTAVAFGDAAAVDDTTLLTLMAREPDTANTRIDVGRVRAVRRGPDTPPTTVRRRRLFGSRTETIPGKRGEMLAIVAATQIAGAAGGLALGTDGRAIGVITYQDIPGEATILPAHRVAPWLAIPELCVALPSRTAGQRWLAFDVTFSVVALPPPPPGVVVEITVSSPHCADRTLTAMPLGDGRYRVTVPALYPSAPSENMVEIVAGQGAPTAGPRFSIWDRMISVGGETVPLSMVTSVTAASPGNSPFVTLLGGRRIRGEITGLDGVPAAVAGTPGVVDLGKAGVALYMHTDGRPGGPLTYQATARVGKTIIATAAGVVPFGN